MAAKKAAPRKKQGYNARLDESLGARNGKKSQSMKARRNESKGAKKAAGKKTGGKSNAEKRKNNPFMMSKNTRQVRNKARTSPSGRSKTASSTNSPRPVRVMSLPTPSARRKNLSASLHLPGDAAR